MSAPAPLRTVRITRNEAQARALVARHARGIALPLPGGWQADLAPRPFGDEPATPAGTWTLRADWAGARFSIMLPQAAARSLLETAAQGLELADVPPLLRAAAFEAAFSHLAAALAGLKRGRARLLEALADAPPAPALVHRFALTLRSGADDLLTGELATDSLGLMLMSGVLAQRPAQDALDPAALPLPCRLRFGATSLPLSLLRTLAPGDVVLVERPELEPRADGGHSLWLAPCADAGLRVALRGATIEILEPWKTLMTADTPSATGADPVDLDAVPVHLTFELGETTLPLAQLQRLQPGQTFDLGRPLTGAVRVRANGAVIAEGELVEIDGNLGVSISRLAGTRE
jgi:type III secretion protein Q